VRTGVVEMTTTHASLTDRYVAAVLAGVPRARRDEVDTRLRASIGAAVDARVAEGDDAADAERAVLTDLGDPMRVSAEHSGLPLQLIGPALYPDYVRLLRLLLLVIVPIAGVVVGAASAIVGASLWDVVLAGLGAAFSVGVQVAFWVTLAFALLERSGTRARRATATWDLDDLPPAASHRIGLGSTIGSITGLVVLIWFLLWQPGYQESFALGGPSIPILAPALSPVWIPFLVCVLLASIALQIVTYFRGRWSVMLAAVNTVLGLAFAIPVIWLIRSEQLLNPGFLTAITTDEVAPVVNAVPALIMWIIAVVTVVDIADGWRKAVRSP
jgi:hypothetical protein